MRNKVLSLVVKFKRTWQLKNIFEIVLVYFLSFSYFYLRCKFNSNSAKGIDDTFQSAIPRGASLISFEYQLPSDKIIGDLRLLDAFLAYPPPLIPPSQPVVTLHPSIFVLSSFQVTYRTFHIKYSLRELNYGGTWSYRCQH